MIEKSIILESLKPVIAWLIRRAVAAAAVAGVVLAPEQETALLAWIVGIVSVGLGAVAEWLMQRHTKKTVEQAEPKS